MFMTGCVVLVSQVVMIKTLTGYNVLVCQGVITKTSQTMSYLH